MTHDPYVYPDTNVLRNLQGIRDPAQLQQLEAQLTRLRLPRIAAHPIDGGYDLAHLQRFHHALFQGLYGWAGELRTVPISKADLFALPQHIQSYGQEIFSELAREHHLAGLTRDELVDRLARHLGNVNALHPFREGNGRAQRAFFTQLAGGLGYELRWQHIDAQRNTTAAIAAMRGNDMPLRQLLDQITVPRSAGAGDPSVDELRRLYAAQFPNRPQPGRADSTRPGSNPDAGRNRER